MNSKLNKDKFYYRFVATSSAGFGTPSHDVHRLRRKAMSNWFSLQAVRGLEPNVQGCVVKLVNQLSKRSVAGKPVNLSHAYRSLATDVVSAYAMPRATNFLDEEGEHYCSMV